MRTYAVALTLLVVCGTVAAAVPAAGAPAGTAASDTDPGVQERAAPDLPEQWAETHGGSGDDIFADLVRTADGGYLLVGWTERDGDTDGWVVKLDGDGQKEYERTLGGSGTDRFWGVARTDDGYLLAGRSDGDAGPRGWTVELDASGEVRKDATTGTGAFYAVARDDSGYLLAGWTRDDGTAGWAVKLDENRSEAWRASYGTPEEYDAGYVRAVVPTAEGYYLAGKIEGSSDDAWALKIGQNGTDRWQATAGSPDRDDVWAAAPRADNRTNDSGFVLAGETDSDDTGPRDGWLVAFGSNGSVAWEQRVGGEGTQWLDSAMRLDDGFLFTGSSDRGPHESADGYVVRTDADGEIQQERYYGTDGWDKPWPAIRAHDGGYVLAGQTGGDGAQGRDGWALKIGTETATADDETASGDNGTTDGESSATTDEALQGETPAGTESAGGVPGFGVLAALIALAGAALLARR